MANNKVQLANGTVLIDITDTTANASDVLSGEYFYNASGVKTEGNLTIPSTYTVTKTLTNVTTNNNDTEVLVGGSFYMDLTPSSGMTIYSITVTMGGIDVTEQVFKAGVGSKTITQNGIYDAEDDWLEGYSSVSVNVQNSYTSSDEGKVVNNGTLVAQTSDTVTQNGTIDTTLINSLTVNVGGGTTPTEYTIDLSGIGWEVGAVGGITNKTYAQNKTTNTARLRPVSLIMTANTEYTYSQNWGNGEWVAQYQCYGTNGKSTSAFTVMTADTILTSSPYIAVVLRHSDGSTAMSVSDVQTIAPKLTYSLSAI